MLLILFYPSSWRTRCFLSSWIIIFSYAYFLHSIHFEIICMIIRRKMIHTGKIYTKIWMFQFMLWFSNKKTSFKLKYSRVKISNTPIKRKIMIYYVNNYMNLQLFIFFLTEKQKWLIFHDSPNKLYNLITIGW